MLGGTRFDVVVEDGDWGGDGRCWALWLKSGLLVSMVAVSGLSRYMRLICLMPDSGEKNNTKLTVIST